MSKFFHYALFVALGSVCILGFFALVDPASKVLAEQHAFITQSNYFSGAVRFDGVTYAKDIFDVVKPAADFGKRQIYDLSGALVVDWSAGVSIADPASNLGLSIDSVTRQAYDLTSGLAINWSSRTLVQADGTTASIDWQNLSLSGGTWTNAGAFSTFGLGSYATDAAVTINDNGWTNTLGKNSTVYVTATAVQITLRNRAAVALYTVTLTGTLPFTLQSGWSITNGSGTISGKAIAW